MYFGFWTNALDYSLDHATNIFRTCIYPLSLFLTRSVYIPLYTYKLITHSIRMTESPSIISSFYLRWDSSCLWYTGKCVTSRSLSGSLSGWRDVASGFQRGWWKSVKVRVRMRERSMVRSRTAMLNRRVGCPPVSD